MTVVSLAVSGTDEDFGLTATDPLPAAVCVTADGAVTVDGVAVVASAAAVGERVEHETAGVHVLVTRLAEDVWRAEVHVHSDGEPGAPWGTEVEVDAFPAYPLWPAGEAEAVPAATETVSAAVAAPDW